MRGPLYTRPMLTEFFVGLTREQVNKLLSEHIIPSREIAGVQMWAASDLEDFAADPDAFRVQRQPKKRTKTLDRSRVRSYYKNQEVA